MYGAEIAMISTEEGKKWSVYRRSDAAFLFGRPCVPHRDILEHVGCVTSHDRFPFPPYPPPTPPTPLAPGSEVRTQTGRRWTLPRELQQQQQLVCGQPPAGDDSVDVEADSSVGLQHGVDQRLAVGGNDVDHAGREDDSTRQLSLQRLLDVGVVEGHAACHHDEEDAAHAPDVVLTRVVRLAAQQLRGGIGGAAAEGLAQVIVGLHAAREAEVGQHDGAVTADEYVFALEVAVT